MSIEKLSDSSKVYVEKVPFTQIPNLIIEHIKDNDAFRLYCYLLSKSRDWKVVKEWAAKHCCIGEKKARSCWSYFERCGLIEYRVNRNEKGQITGYDLIVLNGLKFNPNVYFLNTKSSEAKTAPMEVIHKDDQWGKNPLSGETTRVDFAPLLNKDLLLNKNLKQNKQKSFSSSSALPIEEQEGKMTKKEPQTENQKAVLRTKDEKRKENAMRHDFADSMNQMAREKRHIEENEKLKRSTMPDVLKSDLLNKNINTVQKNTSKNNASTFWGPGHSDWEVYSSYKRPSKAAVEFSDSTHGNPTVYI